MPALSPGGRAVDDRRGPAPPDPDRPAVRVTARPSTSSHPACSTDCSNANGCNRTEVAMEIPQAVPYFDRRTTRVTGLLPR